MSDLSTYFKNSVLDTYLRSQSLTPPTAVYLSLHTASPGLTGTNEASGGSYARQLITFAAASSGSVTSNVTVDFAGMPAATVTHIGLWDAASAGHFFAGGPAGSGLMYATVAATGDLFTSYGHGLVANDPVVFGNDGGAGLPAGVTAGPIYYVLDGSHGLTTDAFKVASTVGGSAIDITADGECTVRKVVTRTLQDGDTYEVASGQAVFTLY